MVISIWQEFENELTLWQEANLQPKFWWRDDDASKPGVKLKQLADISCGLPVSLAIVPNWLDYKQPLAPWLDLHFDNAIVIQHGWAHKNHTKPNQKKSEFCGNRPIKDNINDIIKGDRLLKSIFKQRYQAVFVPPWNRISDNVIAELSTIGYLALSTYGATNNNLDKPIRLNSHVDIINWRKGHKFIGEYNAIKHYINHLAAKRLIFTAKSVERNIVNININEPTGILTHHMDHDNNCWQFLRNLMEFSKNNQMKWLSPHQILL